MLLVSLSLRLHTLLMGIVLPRAENCRLNMHKLDLKCNANIIVLSVVMVKTFGERPVTGMYMLRGGKLFACYLVSFVRVISFNHPHVYVFPLYSSLFQRLNYNERDEPI